MYSIVKLLARSITTPRHDLLRLRCRCQEEINCQCNHWRLDVVRTSEFQGGYVITCGLKFGYVRTRTSFNWQLLVLQTVGDENAGETVLLED